MTLCHAKVLHLFILKNMVWNFLRRTWYRENNYHTSSELSNITHTLLCRETEKANRSFVQLFVTKAETKMIH